MDGQPGIYTIAMGFTLSWKENPPSTHRLILIEVKTHYNWVYAFPRASVKSGFERELFIPYAGLFGYKDDVGKVVTARVTAIHKNHVELDREVPEFGTRIEFDYLLYGAGTTIPQPGRLLSETKAEGISILKQYQKVIRESKQPIIIGGGAVGLGKYYAVSPFLH